MSAVEWRVIPGFTRYSVSSDGEVRRDARMRTRAPGHVKQSLDRDGYLTCTLTADDGKHRKVQTHRHVAAGFLGSAPAGLIVCHGPLGKLVNSATNLRYDTYASNTADARREGTMLVGSRHPTSKLDEGKVAHILTLLAERVQTHKQIAVLFGVDAACIGRIGIGKTWRHVPRPEAMPPKRAKPSNSRKPTGRPPKAARREGVAA